MSLAILCRSNEEAGSVKLLLNNCDLEFLAILNINNLHRN
jgi:hypothetical protein